MPVIKIIPSKGSVNAIRDYITQNNKTSSDYILTSGCCIENPELDFDTLKSTYEDPQHPKERTYYHIIISYNTKSETIAPQDIKEMTEELCRNSKIDCYQWFSAVHYKDTPKHLHCHVIVGNTAIRDSKEQRIRKGKSFRSTVTFRKTLMKEANQMCKEYGYEHSLVSERGKGVRETMAEKAMKAKNQRTWKDELRMQIDDARRNADSFESFKDIMEQSFHVKVMENKKGELRYIPESFEKNDPNCIKPCHERRLGGRYGWEEIERSIDRQNEFREKDNKEHEKRNELER